MSKQITSEKYQAILKTGHDLFWKFGIRRVTIEEICREAGASKMTFYRFFSNKDELAKAVIDTVFDDMRKDYKELMSRDIPFAEKVKIQLLRKFEGTDNISAEFIKDVYGDPTTEFHKYFRQQADEMTKMVFDDYAKAQKDGEIRKDVNLGFVIYMSNKSVEMASDEALQAMYPDMRSLIMEIANLIFYGILEKDKQ